MAEDEGFESSGKRAKGSSHFVDLFVIFKELTTNYGVLISRYAE